MKCSTLGILRCPNCQTALSLHDECGYKTVTEGTLFCSQCDQIFPILDGIPHFIKAQQLEGPNRRFARSYDRLSLFYALFSKVALWPFGGERTASITDIV